MANVNADLAGGSKFENTVGHQLRFWGQLSYFSDRDGEIDFIIDDGQQIGALEVKVTPTKSDQTTLARRAEKLDIELVRVVGREPAAKFKSFLWGGLIK